MKKGDRVKYVGKYAWEMPEVFGPVEWFPPYPPGVIVGFAKNRFHGREVIVHLDGTSEYAHWPVNEVEHA